MRFPENKPIYYFSSISHVVFIDGKDTDKYTGTVFIVFDSKKYAIRCFAKTEENLNNYFKRLQQIGIFLKPTKEEEIETLAPCLLKGVFR